MTSKYRLAESDCRTGNRFLRSISLLALGLILFGSVKAAPFLEIKPAEPSVSSCLAFGAGPGGIGGGSPGFDGTSPYMGFIYQNVPPFELEIGNTLAFDLGLENDFDVEIDIAMAATTVNGGEIEAETFKTVVTNTQTPKNPRGDDVIGNFELQFVAEEAFSFPGGGLIIRFSNGSEAYRQDLTCNESQVGVVATTTDSSGNFVRAFWSDDDGVSPWEPDLGAVSLTREIIGGFQISAIALTNTVLDSSGKETLSAAVGDVVTYEIIVTNTSMIDVPGIEITDTLSDELTFLQTTTNPVAGTVINAGPPQTIVWTVSNLPAGQSATLEIDASVPFGARDKTVVNFAEVTAINSPFETDEYAESALMIVDLPDDILAGDDGGDCFIATAAYGSYLQPEVRVLRNFRDKYLLSHGAGRAFVEWYYRTSPPAAALIREHGWMRTVVRAFLSPAVYGLKYPVPAGFLIVCLLALPIGVSRIRTSRGHV
jgi:uncharacterized repeat protein (TIGR01451 family)